MQSSQLPVGQHTRHDFPRFGAVVSSNYEAYATDTYTLTIRGDIQPLTITPADLATLERIEFIADFHCVTTWSYCGINWQGYRLVDIYEHLIKPHIPVEKSIRFLVFRGMDEFRATLNLEDALTDNVYIVDTMNGEKLSAKHGSPLRLIAPDHYGYKNIKHLYRIDLRLHNQDNRPLLQRIMEHPRGRVIYEERGRYLPGWFFRYLYRPFIEPQIRRMNRKP